MTTCSERLHPFFESKGQELKAGYLFKKGGGAPRSNWKKRYFVLTPLSLNYYDEPGQARAKGLIPLGKLSATIGTHYQRKHTIILRTEGTIDELRISEQEKRVFQLDPGGAEQQTGSFPQLVLEPRPGDRSNRTDACLPRTVQSGSRRSTPPTR